MTREKCTRLMIFAENVCGVPIVAGKQRECDTRSETLHELKQVEGWAT